MQRLNTEQLQQLIKDARILEADHRGVKVYQDPQGNIIKIFRHRRFFSSATFYPYALRFKHHAKILQKKGICSVQVRAVWRYQDTWVLQYPALTGETLRAILSQPTSKRAYYIALLGRYIATLHAQGIFFRSLHLGNILYQTDQQYALIDIADMRIYPLRLFFYQRLRNFRHLFRLLEDCQLLAQYVPQLLQHYFEYSYLTLSQRHTLYQYIRQLLVQKHLSVTWKNPYDTVCYYPLHALPLCWHGEKIYYHPQWQTLLQALFTQYDWKSWERGVAVSQSTITNCFAHTLANGKTVYIKRYVYSRQRPYHWMSRSKAMQEASSYHFLQQLNIPTLNVLAVGELRFLGHLQAAFIVTQALPHTDTLQEIAEQSVLSSCTQKDQIIAALSQQLSKQLRNAHHAYFFHHDIKWRNLLLQSYPDTQLLYWIDCPRGGFHSIRQQHACIVDLSCLARLGVHYLSKTQQYRFILQYLGLSKPNKQSRILYRHTAQHLQKRPSSIPKILLSLFT